MCLLVWLGRCSETLMQLNQCRVCRQEVLPNRAAEAPVIMSGQLLGEDGHPDEAGVQLGCPGLGNRGSSSVGRLDGEAAAEGGGTALGLSIGLLSKTEGLLGCGSLGFPSSILVCKVRGRLAMLPGPCPFQGPVGSDPFPTGLWCGL